MITSTFEYANTVCSRKITATYRRFVMWAIILSVVLVYTASATKKGESVADRLLANGINVNELSTVREAAVSESRHIRILCIQYLASLDEDVSHHLIDDELRVRVEVAKLLVGKPARDAGLTTMTKDYERLISNGMASDRQTFLNLRSQISEDRSLINALEVGKVLAMYGDNRAVKLAQFAVEHAPLEAQRYRAIWILETVLRSEATLAKMGLPTTSNMKSSIKATLTQCAENERDEFVVKQLIASMGRVGGREALDILSSIEHAANQSPSIQKRVRAAAHKIKEAEKTPDSPKK